MVRPPFPLVAPEHNVQFDLPGFTGTAEELAAKIKEQFEKEGKANPEGFAQLVRHLSGGAMRQSGMEGKHERWVMATLNFLMSKDIPFYKYDQYGNKLRGAAGEMEIPERLELLRKKIDEELDNQKAYSRSLFEQRDKAEREVRDLQAELAAANEKIKTLEASSPSAAPPPDPAGS